MSVPRLAPTALVAVVGFAVACGANSVPTDFDEGAQQLAFYRDGEFIYEGNRCFLRPPGADRRHEFQCGVIGIGLDSGVVASDVTDLVASISGTITRDRSSGDYAGWIMVAVPERSERAAILKVFPDDRTRWGALSFSDGGIPER